MGHTRHVAGPFGSQCELLLVARFVYRMELNLGEFCLESTDAGWGPTFGTPHKAPTGAAVRIDATHICIVYVRIM